MGNIQSGRIAAGALADPFTDHANVAIREPKAKNFAPETFMDTRFVKQLEDSGFIKGLYPKA